MSPGTAEGVSMNQHGIPTRPAAGVNNLVRETALKSGAEETRTTSQPGDQAGQLGGLYCISIT